MKEIVFPSGSQINASHDCLEIKLNYSEETTLVRHSRATLLITIITLFAPSR